MFVPVCMPCLIGVIVTGSTSMPNPLARTIGYHAKWKYHSYIKTTSKNMTFCTLYSFTGRYISLYNYAWCKVDNYDKHTWAVVNLEQLSALTMPGWVGRYKTKTSKKTSQLELCECWTHTSHMSESHYIILELSATRKAKWREWEKRSWAVLSHWQQPYCQQSHLQTVLT